MLLISTHYMAKKPISKTVRILVQDQRKNGLPCFIQINLFVLTHKTVEPFILAVKAF